MFKDVQVVNWLLTRRCNLSCALCGIYRKEGYFVEHEMSLKDIKGLLETIEDEVKPFHILYGGEPFLRKDIEDILRLFIDTVGDRFTIYHNGTLNDLVLDIAKRVKLKRLTASVDPMPADKSRAFKSQKGVELLTKAADVGVEDRVATITVDGTTIDYLLDTVQLLTELGIVSNITTFDPPGGPAYDFTKPMSGAEFRRYTLYPDDVKDAFDEILRNDSYLVHFKEQLLPTIMSSLPRNYRCMKPWSALSIDADGTFRLCLRIKGALNKYLTEIALQEPEYATVLFREMQNQLCNGCVWTCIMMTEHFLDVRYHKVTTNQE